MVSSWFFPVYLEKPGETHRPSGKTMTTDVKKWQKTWWFPRKNTHRDDPWDPTGDWKLVPYFWVRHEELLPWYLQHLGATTYHVALHSQHFGAATFHFACFFCSMLEQELFNVHGICNMFSIVEVQLHCRDRSSHFARHLQHVADIEPFVAHGICSILDMIFAACWNFNLPFYMMCAVV
jgi:hypothetical protein